MSFAVQVGGYVPRLWVSRGLRPDLSSPPLRNTTGEREGTRGELYGACRADRYARERGMPGLCWTSNASIKHLGGKADYLDKV
jgi:hypothetical protein